jgi:hypothetical protein
MAGLRTIGNSDGTLGRLDVHFYVAHPFQKRCIQGASGFVAFETARNSSEQMAYRWRKTFPVRCPNHGERCTWTFWELCDGNELAEARQITLTSPAIFGVLKWFSNGEGVHRNRCPIL